MFCRKEMSESCEHLLHFDGTKLWRTRREGGGGEFIVSRGLQICVTLTNDGRRPINVWELS